MMTLCDSCRIYHLVQYIAVLYNLICTLMRIFKYAAYVSLQVCVDRMVIVGRAMQRHKQLFVCLVGADDWLIYVYTA